MVRIATIPDKLVPFLYPFMSHKAIIPTNTIEIGLNKLVVANAARIINPTIGTNHCGIGGFAKLTPVAGEGFTPVAVCPFVPTTKGAAIILSSPSRMRRVYLISTIERQSIIEIGQRQFVRVSFLGNFREFPLS